MSEMVERVAAALEPAAYEWLQAQKDAGEVVGWDDVPMEVFARAAIKAMLAELPPDIRYLVEVELTKREHGKVG